MENLTGSDQDNQNTSTKIADNPVEKWFEKFIVPNFKNDCLPSWNWVLDLAEKEFTITTQIHNSLFAMYQHYEQNMFND